MIDLLGKRYIFFAISLLVIIPGLIFLGVFGLPLAIDFTGGTLLEVSFASGNPPQPAEVIAIYEEFGIDDTQVQVTGEGTVIARSSFLEDETLQGQIIDRMSEEFNDTVTLLSADSVGPTIGREVAGRAALAVGIAAVIVIIYMTFAFRGIENSLRYGICAIIAMMHDVGIVISLAVIGGKFFGWQADALFVTALLTVIGFSVQDKIVVFDRIRENSKTLRRLPFETLVNHSIIQTLQRSINTQLMTVEFMLLALVLFGGVTLREFALILLVGLFSGTYSSIFIAAPILVVWEKKEWRNWFGRGTTAASA